MGNKVATGKKEGGNFKLTQDLVLTKLDYELSSNQRGDKIKDDTETFVKKLRANHLAYQEKLIEYNKLVAETSKIQALARLSSCRELCQLRHDARLLDLEKEILEARGNSVRLDAKYWQEIELAGRMEAASIKQVSATRLARIRHEIEAQEWCIKELGLARIKYEKARRLAEVSSLKRLALALNQYYEALIIDRLAGYVLNAISIKFELDPQIRLKLERPLEGRQLIIEQTVGVDRDDHHKLQFMFGTYHLTRPVALKPLTTDDGDGI